jgi:hypothetical protein
MISPLKVLLTANQFNSKRHEAKISITLLIANQLSFECEMGCGTS